MSRENTTQATTHQRGKEKERKEEGFERIKHKCVSKGVISQPWFTHLGRILPASTKHGNEEPS